ncbi:MAG: hypothetical protein BGO45_10615 [Microbacterium sp. 71-36]|uniref:hypothetical protein n=1 Tax=unclassified Microbacterium TaxID=2609290 RepID=UPI000928D469|nr:MULTISPECIES: hypothetical protein [unclassified Microbacterium]MBN9210718.1 hypothetical protein [Microbacterium sp.]OJV77242.1 MAG: hypothetical protein BGO45_10615 [Microbacterium sp. 71-36]
MTADADGDDLGAVGVPITGFAAVQLTGEPTYLTSLQGATLPIAVPAGYEKVGLFKVDGGPQEGGDAGDAIEFFQRGKKLAGDDQPTIQINLAQFDQRVRRLTTGKTPDANGMIVVSGLTPDTVFPLLVVTKYKNGATRVRNGLARISAVETDQETRGEVNGRAVTFEWIWDETVGGFYRDWLIQPTSATAKTGWAVTITGTPTGGTFTLSLNGVNTPPIAFDASASAVSNALNGLAGVTGISGITASGTGPYTVTLPTAAVLALASKALTGGSSPSVTVA